MLLAQAYTGADVQTPEDALAGARDILAERISDDANARKRLRVVMMANGFLCSKAAGEDAGVYAPLRRFQGAPAQGRRTSGPGGQPGGSGGAAQGSDCLRPGPGDEAPV